MYSLKRCWETAWFVWICCRGIITLTAEPADYIWHNQIIYGHKQIETALVHNLLKAFHCQGIPQALYDPVVEFYLIKLTPFRWFCSVNLSLSLLWIPITTSKTMQQKTVVTKLFNIAVSDFGTINLLVVTLSKGGSRISQRGNQPSILPKCPENCMKMKKTGPEGESKVWLCRSATCKWVLTVTKLGTSGSQCLSQLHNFYIWLPNDIN